MNLPVKLLLKFFFTVIVGGLAIYGLFCIVWGCYADRQDRYYEEVVESIQEIRPEGRYVSQSNKFYHSITFKGESTVTIEDGIWGMSFATSYEKDGVYVRVRTDQSDLLFAVISSDTLVGEGFAKGIYVKYGHKNEKYIMIDREEMIRSTM